MTRRTRERKMLSMLAAGCLLLQLTGCGPGDFWNRFQVGFAEQFGAFTANVVIDVFGLEEIAPNICLGPGCGNTN